MYTNDMRVDYGMVDSFKLYFLYGLCPGSCSSYILSGEYEEARAHAHPMIKGDEIWNDHIKFVETVLPECCRGKNMSGWEGYFVEIVSDPELETMIRTQKYNTLVSEWIVDSETSRLCE